MRTLWLLAPSSLALSWLILTAACHRAAPSLCDDAPGDPTAGDQRNVLVIVTDDIGIDKTAAYDAHPAPPPTPTLDRLAAEGVVFRNAYATPSCSATRASLLTGRQPSRHGVGHWIYPDTEEADLDLPEVTVPEMLEAGPYAYTSAAVGKWHLVSFLRTDPAAHPLDQGFRCHAGSLANPLDAVLPGHTPRSYRRWEKSVDGAPDWEGTYMTLDTTDEALARLRHLPSPWFLYVAYNGAHEPYEPPPASLTTRGVDRGSTDLALYEAMVEAVDTEIGRLLDGIPDDVRRDTTVVYLSDNGTPAPATTPPWNPNRAKNTLYEGGVHIPLLITGPLVARPGSESDALVHVVDLFPTVAEIAGVDLATVAGADGEPVVIDGQSLVPYLADPTRPSAREVLYTEGFYPNGAVARSYHDRMVRNADWKLMRAEAGGAVVEQLFRMEPGAWDEGPDLLAAGADNPEAAEALALLRAEMARVQAVFP